METSFFQMCKGTRRTQMVCRFFKSEKIQRFKGFGRIQFSKSLERSLFFCLTLVMLVMGILVKIGIL